ncbi:something about silencing, SAS, complex subunit 4-domain-containing protein [Pseudomassariella vexata]|uniref:Something about silencing, SAS, complex subunit 4-domain-containing protein n=1 Tax=Pseudomassariella vexata TaxID=1141098 RepID=A0A1Y2EAN7_9PEZI|nr:something about silencing, SAS, complex subunit 4-domain-containing protein [Pseudomassariella vexata]ORY68650.1 something about silencing, SAS, complex subunit 4-domain-containing protein [Pseudomassariella vexata]
MAAKHAQIIATHTTRNHQNILQPNSSTRMKRPLDPIDSNSDSLKRARITVEILARPIPQPISPPKTITVKPLVSARRMVVTAEQQQSEKPLPPPSQPQPPPPTQSAAEEAAPKTATITQPGLTRHQEKVINGIKHELDRLQPAGTDANVSKEGGRKLRSQEASRFKSELSAYFPDYDEVIGNDAKEHHVVNIDSPLIVVDSQSRRAYHDQILPPGLASQPSSIGHDPELTRRHGNQHTQDPPIPTQPIDGYAVRSYGDALFTNLFDAQQIDLDFLGAGRNDRDIDDPLPDSHYELAHKRAERLEKSIRNTEKGRAQHEKDQIIRLLGELQGPDWLRTMGVSGVTETRKKTFEPAREHFIKGCQAILEKFRLWNEEEKRRKREREQAKAAEEESQSEEADEPAAAAEEEEEEEEDEPVASEEEEMGHEESTGNISDGDPPDYSDVDESIAKQLHEEAIASAKFAPSVSSKRTRGEAPPMMPSEPYVPPREFTSFFRKRHEREAALNIDRRRGRNVMAWGCTVPEAHENSFDLPEEYRDEDTMKARARRKRRDLRGSRR